MQRAAAWTAIAVAVGIVAAVALAWDSLPTPVDCNAPPTGNTPLGSAMAFGTPVEQIWGANHWYNATVASSDDRTIFDDLNFGVQTEGGEAISPGPGWSALMLNYTGYPIGNYTLYGPTAGNWSEGGSTLLQSQQTFSLLSDQTRLAGDNLRVSDMGLMTNGCPFSESLTVEIP
jgi:hypothetical protein